MPKIDITATHNNSHRLDFEIHLINNNNKIKKVYKIFCNRLKSIIRNGNREILSNNKIGGVSFKGDNVFKNYPTDIFIKFSLCFAFFGYRA